MTKRDDWRAVSVAKNHTLLIIDRCRNLRGRCGPRMSQASLPRFGLRNGARLGKYKGHDAWLERKKP